MPIARGLTACLPFLLVLVAGPRAHASDDAGVGAATAEAAAAILEENCAEVAAGEATTSAQSLAAVGVVFAEVSRVFDETGAVFLLFWRGRLGLCLSQDARAAVDFQAFLDATVDDPIYRTQVGTARRLLERLQYVPIVPSAEAAGVVGGILLGAGGVLGGLSGWQADLLAQKQLEFDEGERMWSTTNAIGGEGADTAAVTNGLLVGAATAALAGGVSLAVAGTLADSPRTVVALVPSPRGGVSLQVAGRW